MTSERCAHASFTNSVLMIRPCRFYPNPETAADNAFQARLDCAADALSTVGAKEFDAAVQKLRAAGVNVHVFEDTAEPEKPDAVFPKQLDLNASRWADRPVPDVFSAAATGAPPRHRW